MKEVKRIYLATAEELKELGGITDYRTGLVLELEDGTMWCENTTDPIQTYSKVTQ